MNQKLTYGALILCVVMLSVLSVAYIAQGYKMRMLVQESNAKIAQANATITAFKARAVAAEEWRQAEEWRRIEELRRRANRYSGCSLAWQNRRKDIEKGLIVPGAAGK